MLKPPLKKYSLKVRDISDKNNNNDVLDRSQ